MSKLIKEAKEILLNANPLNIDEYKRFKAIGRQLTDEEDLRKYAWYSEGIFQLIPDLIQKEGNDNFLEEEDK